MSVYLPVALVFSDSRLGREKDETERVAKERERTAKWGKMYKEWNKKYSIHIDQVTVSYYYQ